MKFPAVLTKSILAASVVLSCLLSARGQDLTTLAMPWPAVLEHKVVACRVEDPATLVMSAPAGSNIFLSPDGGFHADNAPRVLFKPEGPFILTAKIQPEFREKWDGGVLLIYNDAEHYAKFCYEADYRNTPRIVSVVCNERGDDCNSAPVSGGAVYYRIAGSSAKESFAFYASADGRTWYLIRTFRLTRIDNLRVGFSAQSPAGAGCTVRFSEIKVERREVKDFWNGD